VTCKFDESSSGTIIYIYPRVIMVEKNYS